MSVQYTLESNMSDEELMQQLYKNPFKLTYCRDTVIRIVNLIAEKHEEVEE